MENAGATKRPAALVTGASSGIGAQLARGLAARGHDLVLVARRAEPMRALADELARSHAATVHVCVQDLAAADAAERVVEAVERLGVDLAVLVNNAGVGLGGRLVDLDPAVERDMMALNVIALQQLTRLVLPRLLRRGAGRILNVGSTAGLQPVPMMATYAATKAFVISFSQALADELRDTGVTVTALCPGPTDTDFAATAGVTATRLFSPARVSSAEHVARIGLDAMERGRAVVIPGAWNRLLAWGARLSPRQALRVSRSLMQPSPRALVG